MPLGSGAGIGCCGCSQAWGPSLQPSAEACEIRLAASGGCGSLLQSRDGNFPQTTRGNVSAGIAIGKKPRSPGPASTTSGNDQAGSFRALRRWCSAGTGAGMAPPPRLACSEAMASCSSAVVVGTPGQPLALAPETSTIKALSPMLAGLGPQPRGRRAVIERSCPSRAIRASGLTHRVYQGFGRGDPAGSTAGCAGQGRWRHRPRSITSLRPASGWPASLTPSGSPKRRSSGSGEGEGRR